MILLAFIPQKYLKKNSEVRAFLHSESWPPAETTWDTVNRKPSFKAKKKKMDKPITKALILCLNPV